jgi:hypothetical protein
VKYEKLNDFCWVEFWKSVLSVARKSWRDGTFLFYLITVLHQLIITRFSILKNSANQKIDRKIQFSDWLYQVLARKY